MREECDLVDATRTFDDHHQAHTDQLDINFAKQIAGEVELVTRERVYTELLVVANARMLGQLRHSLEPLRRTVTVTELERDFTKLSTTELRQHLADLALLPPRPRLVFANR